ncbi:MAG: YkgJ family cysteine cluster protein [Chitinophagaceae bacterium]
MLLQTSLEAIDKIASEKADENVKFADLIRKLDPQELDNEIAILNQSIEPQIDCTACANCCKSLMIQVSAEEANHNAELLHISRESFDDTYLEKGSHDLMIMNTIPCAFLSNNKCSIYEHRFEGCREFPGLHLPHFHKRIFSVMMHYGRCPIVFNVIEALKTAVHFNPASAHE